MPVDFLIDNGSTASILSYKKYNDLQPELTPGVRPIKTVVYDASGNTIQTYGAIDVKICLSGFEFDQTLIICDIHQDGIIGQDFLLKYAETISYKHGRINTQFNEIICWLGDETMTACRVVVRRTITIPSFTATWLPIDIPGSENLTKYGYVEPTVTPDSDLAIIPGILDLQKAEKCISIINHSEDPITLYAKQPVGTCEAYEDNPPDTDECQEPMHSPDSVQHYQLSGTQGDHDVHEQPNYATTYHSTTVSPYQSVATHHTDQAATVHSTQITPYSPESVQANAFHEKYSTDHVAIMHSHESAKYSTDKAEIPISTDCMEESTGHAKLNSQADCSDTQEVPDFLNDLFTRSSQHLSTAEKCQLADLLNTYQDVFAMSSSDLGRCERVQHRIHTGDAIPVRQPARRLPFGKRIVEQQEIHKMLEKGVIEPFNSPWSSPIVLVTKKDGSIRFCVDYRVLNTLTVKDAYP
ncbi:MAG: hypothetical protein LC540_19555, partial [Candidatus Thiodiazotropha sp.]|nr:hypothetical protein [Candidatus Thiodiazotropha sp.]